MGFGAWVAGFFETDTDRYIAARALVVASYLAPPDAPAGPFTTSTARMPTPESAQRWPSGGPTLVVGDRAFYTGIGQDSNGVTWTAGDMVLRSQAVLDSYAVNLPGEASPGAAPALVGGAQTFITGPLPWAVLLVVGAVAVAYVVRATK